MVGKKLTAAQLEAAKNRMAGRAPPGVASRPSVDGFRASEPLTDKKRVDGLQNKPALKNRNKVSELVFIEFPSTLLNSVLFVIGFIF